LSLSEKGTDSTFILLLMNSTVWPLMVVWTLISLALAPLAVVAGIYLFCWEKARVVRLLVWLYGRGWMLILRPFVRFTFVDFDKGYFLKPGIIVANHLSFFDTYCMAGLPCSNIVFAVRSWPFKMFWYSKIMRMARYLDVEGSDWEQTVAAGKRVVEEKAALVFWPEGHRSRDGQLQRFYSGAFKLAVHCQVPVTPLCITGTEQLLPPGRHWLAPANIVMRALPPVDTADFSGPTAHVELRKMVKSQIAQALEEMRN